MGYLTPLDILSVVLTCQFFQLFGEPFLYRRICIDWRSNWNSALILFKAVTQRTQLAGYIQHLTLTSRPNSGVNGNVSSRAVTEDFGSRCKRRRVEGGKPCKESAKWLDWAPLDSIGRTLIEQIGLPNAQIWHEAVRFGDPFVYVSLIISQLQNLQTLRFDLRPSENMEFVGLMVKHALFSAPAAIRSSFSQLRLVQYGAESTLDQAPCTDEDAETPAMFVDPEPRQTTSWFFLPALLSLAIWTSEIPILLDTIRDSPSQAHNLARIERLSIRSYQAEETYFAQLLALTSSVKTLHLALSSWFTDSQLIRFSSPLSTGENLLRGLLAVRETLEDLRIQLSLFPHRTMEETDALAASLKPFAGFLVNFLVLRTAEVQAAMLLGRYDEDRPVDLAQLLPPGLQSLCIRVDATGSSNTDLGWDAARILRCVRCSLPHLGTVAPNLTTIAVRRVGSSSLLDKDEAEMARTVETVEELGLGVRVVWVSGKKRGMVSVL